MLTELQLYSLEAILLYKETFQLDVFKQHLGFTSDVVSAAVSTILKVK